MCFQSCSKSYFLEVWRDKCNHIKCRKYLRFSKCKTCHELRKIKYDKKDKKAKHRERTEKHLREHYNFVKRERAYSLLNKIEAIKHPEDVLFIAQDGTDQLCYGLPHFIQHRSDSKTDRLKMHLMIDYVAGHNVYIYNHLDNVYGDPNLTIECLWRTLKHVEKERGVLPRKLFLQLDNSTRENRNSYVFAMLGWWVEQGAFDEIEVCFLPVGHTHNEPDQVRHFIMLI